MPFYSHEIDAYWNDIGNLEELRESSLDALTAPSGSISSGEVVDGYRSGPPADDEGELVGPVLLGPGCEIGADVRIDGPGGDRRRGRVGEGQPAARGDRPARGRDRAGSVLIGAIAAAAAERRASSPHRPPVRLPCGARRARHASRAARRIGAMEILHAVAAFLRPAALRGLWAFRVGLRRLSVIAVGAGWPRPSPCSAGGPAGLDRAWSSAPYDGVTRNLVAALKFRHLLPVADLMAERIQWLAPGHSCSGPSSRFRRRRCGCDGGGSIRPMKIATALAACLPAGGSFACLARRGGPRTGRPSGAPSGSATRRRSHAGREAAPQRPAGRRRAHHRRHADRLRRRRCAAAGAARVVAADLRPPPLRRPADLCPTGAARPAGRASGPPERRVLAAACAAELAVLLDLPPQVLGQLAHAVRHLRRCAPAPAASHP